MIIESFSNLEYLDYYELNTYLLFNTDYYYTIIDIMVMNMINVINLKQPPNTVCYFKFPLLNNPTPRL